MSLRTLTLAAMATVSFFGWTTAASAMDGYRWKHRPLVVFAPDAGDARLARQVAIVDALKPAFIDRSVVVVVVAGGSVKADLGPAPKAGADALRAQFGIAPGEFKVLLVGKDGGVKLTSGQPIPAQKLFHTIDAMPMRADEVRRSR